MICFDTSGGKYRLVLRCDKCGREINDAYAASGFFSPEDGRLIGIFCHESCSYGACLKFYDCDAWQVHHMLAMLKETIGFREKQAKKQLDELRSLAFIL